MARVQQSVLRVTSGNLEHMLLLYPPSDGRKHSCIVQVETWDVYLSRRGLRDNSMESVLYFTAAEWTAMTLSSVLLSKNDDGFMKG